MPSYVVCVFCCMVFAFGESQERREDFISIRLVGGPVDAPNSGNVEVLPPNSVWLNVCDNMFWGITDGMVACRQLGFPGFARARRGSYFGEGVHNVSVGGIGCSGGEDNLGQCDNQPIQQTGCVGNIGAAGLICTVPGYLGCYSDDNNDPVFDGDNVLISTDMTVGLCLNHCQQQTMRYAGLKNQNECFCGDEGTGINPQRRKRDRVCNVECSGNRDEVCGGWMTLSLYNLALGHCEDPGILENGGHLPSAGPFRYASNINFFCDVGFELIGSDSTRCILGNAPQTVRWDKSKPFCQSTFDKVPTTTQDPVGGSGQVGGIGTGATVGIVVACIVISIIFALLVKHVFGKRKRKRQANGNAPRPTEIQLDNSIYSEPIDPRYHTTPVRTSTSAEYQDLDLSKSNMDAEKPYTLLQAECPSKRASRADGNIPEYLELYDSMPADAVFHGAESDEYSTLEEQNIQAVYKTPSGKAAQQSAPAAQQIQDNEYSHIVTPQLRGACNTNNAGNQYIKDTSRHDDTQQVENAYYTLPPDAR